MSCLSSLRNHFFWTPTDAEFSAPFQSPTIFEQRLDRLRRGIDNTHVDVQLSTQFQSRALGLVRQMLEDETTQTNSANTDRQTEDAFRDAYTGMMVVAIDDARQQAQPELIQLLQFAVIKYLLQLVSEQQTLYYNRLRRQHADSAQDSDDNYKTDGSIALLNERALHVRHEVIRKLLPQILMQEATILRKLRKSVIGISWPVPRRVLFNPMLHISDLWQTDLLMTHYTLIYADKKEAGLFNQWNNILVSAFSDYLPDCVIQGKNCGEAVSLSPAEDATESTRGIVELLDHALCASEYQTPLYSWLDRPQNLDLFMNSADPSRAISVQHNEGWIKQGWPQSKWPDFQRRTLDHLVKQVQRARLMPYVLAAYRTPELFRALRGEIPAGLIFRYLRGSTHLKDLERRLRLISLKSKIREIVGLLRDERQQLKRIGPWEQRTFVIRYLRDLAVFRRDLKYAWQAQQAMRSIRILHKPEEIKMSASGHSLHRFLLRDEGEEHQQRIRNHVVVKADIRGSTRMTEELRHRKLNPASHFSLNFFTPITKLLEKYGAEKTFVEGDAVILTIYEYEDESSSFLAVCQACGLAAEMLRVVDTQNSLSRKNDLPELELGLGISFEDGAPTFLYDEDRKITISPAINRADQLSSCSYLLRQSSINEERKGRGVEVVAPTEGVVSKPGGDDLLHYNVNGIELDAAAFFKLKQEVSLKRMQLAGDFENESIRLYVGRYPDRSDEMHWLLIREAPIRLLIGNTLETLEQDGRLFYEVVTDEALLSRVKERMQHSSDQNMDMDEAHNETSVATTNPDSHYLH
ncbi:MAG: hypothetical protein KZQ58_04625 [gamma proteobacterium symbiont of Bathyaustriella thionipta]|nr:hypothetical protein [gamma proteobacterium symbiont of Bathyaustriella thionipta]